MTIVIVLPRALLAANGPAAINAARGDKRERARPLLRVQRLAVVLVASDLVPLVRLGDTAGTDPHEVARRAPDGILEGARGGEV